MKCPFCDAEVSVPTVDIGVGEQQCGPADCPNCGAAQDSDGRWHEEGYWLQKRIEGGE